MHLVVGLTGASGAFATKLLIKKSPWKIALIASEMGRKVYEQEVEPFDALAEKVDYLTTNDDLCAPFASGTVPTHGMVILPSSTNTLGKIAHGISDSLITRAAHCHLKERRRLVICVRESPWSLINLRNATTISEAGGIIMPISPPYYMSERKTSEETSVQEIMDYYIDHVLAVLGHPAPKTWENSPLAKN